MKKRIMALVLLSTLVLSACSNPLSALKKDDREETITYELTASTADQLQENMFYVKNGDAFYPIHMGQTNIETENLIAKESDPERIISFTKDDVMIPTLYKDDSLIYYTKSSVPTFTWERLKDYGYTVGLYNLKKAESGKVQFVVGESKTDHGSAAFTGLSQLEIGDAVIILDKVGGQSLTADRLSDCGSIIGLKPDEMANIDLYIGTQHYIIESTVDTHVLSSMELYQTNEYNLMPEGYASVKIPDYFLSGYYFINGVGVVKYVANDRSEGVANIDFSVPYFYKDDTGKQYTLEEWNKLNGVKTEESEKIADYEFSYDIDSTVKAFNMSLKYELKENENINDILYSAPTATIISPLGEETEFEPTTEDDKQLLTVSINGVVSGEWHIKIYDLGERKFSVASAIETGNADSFVHSGKTSGKFAIHSDGVSGPAMATVKWENATHAANIEIKTPSGSAFNDKDNLDMLIEDGYGEKMMLFEGAEAGTWELTITGEELGRCWFNIEKYEASETQFSTEESKTDVHEEPNDETPQETQVEQQVE